VKTFFAQRGFNLARTLWACKEADPEGGGAGGGDDDPPAGDDDAAKNKDKGGKDKPTAKSKDKDAGKSDDDETAKLRKELKDAQDRLKAKDKAEADAAEAKRLADLDAEERAKEADKRAAAAEHRALKAEIRAANGFTAKIFDRVDTSGLESAEDIQKAYEDYKTELQAYADAEVKAVETPGGGTGGNKDKDKGGKAEKPTPLASKFGWLTNSSVAGK
jgi:hypothetical protein